MAKRLHIIAHAPSPNTVLLKDAVLRGAQKAGAAVDVRWIPPLQASAEDVMAADGLILGTTENLGYMSGALKDFFDRIYYPVLEEKQGLPFATYIRAGLDGTGTKRAIESITTGLKWKQVQEVTLFHGEWQDSFLRKAETLGEAMAYGVEAAIF